MITDKLKKSCEEWEVYAKDKIYLYFIEKYPEEAFNVLMEGIKEFNNYKGVVNNG